MPKHPPQAVSAPQVHAVDHRDAQVAARILAILRLTYTQEAAALGAIAAPPLGTTADDICGSAQFFLGAFIGAELVGVLALGPDDEPGQLHIATLVVHPQHQRRGAARALLLDLMQRAEGITLSVSAGAANAPALALYQGLGFEVYRRGIVGAEGLALVKLRRAAATRPGAGE